MIHTMSYERELFEAIVTGRKSFVDLEGDPEVLVGDFLAINERVLVPLYTEPDNYAEEMGAEYTGRCCLVEVVYIEMTADNETSLASVRPCCISTASDRMMQYARNIYEVPTYDRAKGVTRA